MVSMLLDGKMTAGEEENALAHVRSCQACHARFQSERDLRLKLRSMSRTPAPGGLMGQLRVLASHERERRLRRASFSSLFGYWAGRMRLQFDNLMRPVAPPIAGGLISALLLVGVWAADVQWNRPNGPAMGAAESVNDVPLPLWLYDGPSGKDVRSVRASCEVVLTIDERGRVTDFIVTSGEMTPDLGDMILRSRFNPATVFGQPTPSRLVYRHISVIG